MLSSSPAISLTLLPPAPVHAAFITTGIRNAAGRRDRACTTMHISATDGQDTRRSSKRSFNAVAAALSFVLLATSCPHGVESFMTPPPSQIQRGSAVSKAVFQRKAQPEKTLAPRMSAEEVVEEHVMTNVKDGVFVLTNKDQQLEAALKEMMQRSPTPDPGDWQDDKKTAQFADGRWEVAYAPHISSLQKLILMDFGPIRYDLGSEGEKRTIVSNVQYKSPLFGQGWFNAAGTYSSLSSSKVRINFELFWWDQNSKTASPPPATPPKTLVQMLGKAGFIPAFSKFPVKYLDSRTCVFDFELSGTSILARKMPQ